MDGSIVFFVRKVGTEVATRVDMCRDEALVEAKVTSGGQSTGLFIPFKETQEEGIEVKLFGPFGMRFVSFFF